MPFAQMKPFARVGLGLLVLNEIRGAIVVACVIWSWLQHGQWPAS